MPWQKQHHKSFYSRRRRVNGRVITEYLGRARKAALAAMSDAELAAERAQARVEREQYDQLKDLVDTSWDQFNLLLTAHLLINGYHQHKRQWRKIRVLSKPEPERPDQP